MIKDLARFKLDPTMRPKRRPAPKRPRVGKQGQYFLRGPIPLNWLCRAAALPGQSVVVALELWFLHGLTKSTRVKLNLSRLHVAPIMARSTAGRALRCLEDAGLVKVERKVGRAPRVTILSPDQFEGEASNVVP